MYTSPLLQSIFQMCLKQNLHTCTVVRHKW